MGVALARRRCRPHRAPSGSPSSRELTAIVGLTRIDCTCRQLAAWPCPRSPAPACVDVGSGAGFLACLRSPAPTCRHPGRERGQGGLARCASAGTQSGSSDRSEHLASTSADLPPPPAALGRCRWPELTAPSSPSGGSCLARRRRDPAPRRRRRAAQSWAWPHPRRSTPFRGRGALQASPRWPDPGRSCAPARREAASGGPRDPHCQPEGRRGKTTTG
jgi:hypothetical protein